MTQFSSFLLVPNHSFSVDGENFYIESAEREMLQFLRGFFSKIGISAFESKQHITSLSGKISTKNFTLHSLNVFNDKGNFIEKGRNYLYAAIAAPFVINKYKFVYIFCPGYCAQIFALWSIILRVPFGLYVRGTWKNSKGKSSRQWNYIFGKAALMIVTGESFRDELKFYSPRVENEVPLTKMRPQDIHISKDYQTATKSMIFAGRLSEAKGIFDVVKAFSLLKEQHPDIKLYIAGGGTDLEKQTLNELVAKLSLNDNVEFLGHLPPDELARMYQKCGIFVFPSYFAEGFPRVLYEAMMHGCSIVTCEMPGTAGFLINDRNCLTTPPRNPNELAKHLLRLLNEPTTAEALAHNARIAVERVYESFKDTSHSEQLHRMMRSCEKNNFIR